MNTLRFKIKAIALLVFVTLSLGSCEKKFLDVSPDNRTKINTVQKVAQLTGTAYPTADYLTFTEAASDNSEDKGPGVGDVNDLITTYYTWQDYPGAETNSAGNYWNGCYEAIASANQALESIETGIEKGYFSAQEVAPFKGEALVGRAYAHHMLAIFFAKAYEIDGDNSSPGIPYVTKPETVLLAKYTRGTVQSTYDNIEKDLEAGIKLIDDSKYKVPAYHFTKAAAHAFAARFYLFEGKWDSVVAHASAVVPSGDWKSQLRPIAGKWKEEGFAQFHIDFSKSDVKSTLLLASCYSTYQRIYTTPRYGYGEKLVQMFSQPNVTGKELANFILNYGLPNYTTYKWREFFYYATATTGYPYLPVVLLSVDETLMNRAEAYAELGKYNLALKDINTFYSVRISNYNPSTDEVTLQKIQDFYGISDPKEGIIKTILDAKKAAFLQEGIRWMDIVRKHLTVKKNLYSPTGVESFITLEPDDPRRVFQIPEEAELAGIKLNPR